MAGDRFVPAGLLALGRSPPSLEELEHRLHRVVFLIAELALNTGTDIPGLQGFVDLILLRLTFRRVLLCQSHQVGDPLSAFGRPSGTSSFSHEGDDSVCVSACVMGESGSWIAWFSTAEPRGS